MNRSVGARGANGIDSEMRTRDPREEDQPLDEWRRHVREGERAEEYRYGYARQQERPYGGFIGDHDRFAEPSRYWQEEQDRERLRRLGRLPPSPPLPPREVWRGRNEQYDFWGRERHPLHDQHPSFWSRVKGAFHGKGPKNYVRSDDRIREDVCEHLSYHPYIDASDIEVIVRGGEVTLSGSVDARMVKRAAEECCDHVRGVRDVHNQLRVRAEGEPAP